MSENVVGFDPKLHARVKQLEQRVVELDLIILKQQKQLEQVAQSTLTLAGTVREIIFMIQRMGV